MKEFIEKLIAKLEEKFKYNSEQAEIYRDGSDKDAYFREKKDLYMDRANTYGQIMRIINELAEEYKGKYVVSKAVLEQIMWERDIAIEQLKELGYGLGEKVGWIPVSERLPEEKPFGDSEHTCSDGVLITVKHDRGTTVGMGCLTRGRWFYLKGTTEIDVIAWKPLPEPYKEGEN